MKNKDYAKFGGANKVHYGKCGSGVLKVIRMDRKQLIWLSEICKNEGHIVHNYVHVFNVRQEVVWSTQF